MRLPSFHRCLFACIFLLVTVPLFLAAEQAVTIRVSDNKQQRMRYGMDYERLWFWYGSGNQKETVAQWSVVDCDIDFIRVAINPMYELKEGAYDLSAYTKKIIPMMQSMKAANPQIKFFASPRPLNEVLKGAAWQPYPFWITGDPGDGSSFDFNVEKCADFLIRYLLLMKSYGFRIHYLDVTNEWNYIKAEHVGDLKRAFERYVKNPPRDSKLVLEAADIPLLIAPSTWSYKQGVEWLQEAKKSSKRRSIDIAASHNTDPGGSAKAFAEEVRSVLGKNVEIWNTELHDWKSSDGYDEVTSVSYLFDAIRAGFSGISGWLAIGTPKQGHSYILHNGKSVKRNVKYFIFKKLTNTSNTGHALDVTQPSKLTSTAAMLKDDLLTVWVNNASGSAVPIEVQLDSFRNPSGFVRMTRWSESIEVEGITETFKTTPGSDSFPASIAANSVYCFEIILAN
ncbi:MAG: hypothetical protein ACSHYA_07975 [Opitutaceae bacterium]